MKDSNKVNMVTFKQVIENNANLKEERKTLGHAISELEKVKDNIFKELTEVARVKENYTFLTANVKKSKTGKYSAWAVQMLFYKLCKEEATYNAFLLGKPVLPVEKPKKAKKAKK